MPKKINSEMSVPFVGFLELFVNLRVHTAEDTRLEGLCVCLEGLYEGHELSYDRVLGFLLLLS